MCIMKLYTQRLRWIVNIDVKDKRNDDREGTGLPSLKI